MSSLNSLPLPAVTAGGAALVALPFSAAAGATLLLAAALGFVIHADYTLRLRRARLPRRPATIAAPHFRRFALCREHNCLAA